MSVLEDEIDAKYPLPDIPFCGELTGNAKQRSYEQERIDYRKLHSLIEGKDEAACTAREDTSVKEKLKHRWNSDRSACVFCGVAWDKLYG